jgi:hypothetical protein
MAQPALEIREYLAAPEQRVRPESLLPLLRSNPDLITHACPGLDLRDHVRRHPVPCDGIVVLETGRRGDQERALAAIPVEQEQLRFRPTGRGHRLHQRPQVQADPSGTVEQHRVPVNELALEHVRQCAWLAPPPGPSFSHVVARHDEHIGEHERGLAQQLGERRNQAQEL